MTEQALFPRLFATDDLVQVTSPGRYERGTWRVVGVVATTADSSDPAYDVENRRTGRQRVFHGSRLELSRVGRGA